MNSTCGLPLNAASGARMLLHVHTPGLNTACQATIHSVDEPRRVSCWHACFGASSSQRLAHVFKPGEPVSTHDAAAQSI